MWHTVAIGRLLQMWLMSNQASKSVQENEILFLEGLLLMPHINELTLWRAHTRLEEACCIWLPFTIVPLFIHWINASYIQLLSIGLFVFCNQLVCLLFHPHAYLDQTFNSTMTLSPLKTWLFFAKFTPPSIPFLPSICGSKISHFNFFFLSFLHRMWKCFIGVAKNNEDKTGLCGGRNAFLTHVNEWCLTFHSSRPFTEWQH